MRTVTAFAAASGAWCGRGFTWSATDDHPAMEPDARAASRGADEAGEAAMMPYLAIGLGVLLLLAVAALWLADSSGALDHRPRMQRTAKAIKANPWRAAGAVATGGLLLAWMEMRKRRKSPAARLRDAVERATEAAAESRERVDVIVEEGEAERRDFIDDLRATADAMDAETEARVSVIHASAEGRTPDETAATLAAMAKERGW